MQNTKPINVLFEKLNGYKKLYLFNAFLRGTFISVLVLFSAFILVNSAEYWGRLPSIIRTGLFFTYVGLATYFIFRYVGLPLLQLARFKEELSDEKAANQIGDFFPQVKDKLVNVIQLNRSDKSALVEASLSQKAIQLSDIQFNTAIDINKNFRFLRWLVFPFAIAILLYLLLPGFFTESTERLIRFRTEFTPPPPFQFLFDKNEITAYKNEDVTVQVQLKGNSLPENVYLEVGNLRHKMDVSEAGIFSYTIPSVTESQSLRFEAGGYYSDELNLLVKNKPLLTGFSIQVSPPSYTGVKSFIVKNTGNLAVPQGSTVRWEIQSDHTDEVAFVFPEGEKKADKKLISGFEFTKRILAPGTYSIQMKNEETPKANGVSYDLSVILDKSPQITLRALADTLAYSFLAVSGQITDDYGFNKLLIHYRKVTNTSTNTKFNILPLKINPQSVSQNYYQYLTLDSLKLSPGERIEYFVEIWDNDQISGSKATRTGLSFLQLPTKENLQKEIEKSGEDVEKQLETSLEKAKDLQKELKKIDSKIKSKKSLNWQDKKQIEDALKKHEELKNALEELKEKNEKLNQQSSTISEKNEKVAEKTKMLEELMKSVLDEETKKLYEELQKLMQEKSADQQIQQQLEKIQKKDVDIEKELDRALEMFKQLQFEQKLDNAIDDLNKLAEEQKQLAEETEKQSQKPDASQTQDKKEELAQKQKELNQKLEQQKDALKDLEQLNKDLENPNELDEKASEDLQEAGQDQKQGSESLENNNKKDAAKSQKKAADKMKKAADKMAKAKSQEQNQQAAENIKDLKQILDNLLTLSFNQEELMKELKVINQQDPNYLKLTQNQLKIKDDSKIIEDSLLALAKRVHQIKSFVTREVTSMQNYIDESIKAVRQRRPDMAAGKGQFAMTSMNNLALMLNEVLSKMQDEQQDGKATGGMMCKKPGKKGKPTSLGNLQKQLSQRIQQLQKSGATGKALSKELAKMAAEQEMLRNSLKELDGGKEGQDGKNGSQAGSSQQLKELAKKMEENEKDLVNKRITQETILRQNEILTRLLEAEQAKRERETDQKRESNTGKVLEKPVPPSIEKYLQEKEKQIELLRTIPPSLTPYYKKEVNEYFQKLQN